MSAARSFVKVIVVDYAQCLNEAYINSGDGAFVGERLLGLARLLETVALSPVDGDNLGRVVN